MTSVRGLSCRLSASFRRLARPSGCSEAESKGKRIPDSNVTAMPSPTRDTCAPGMSLASFSACWSMWRPIRAPAAPPTTAPMMAPRTVEPVLCPMTAPTAPPPAAPMAPPFLVRFQLSQPPAARSEATTRTATAADPPPSLMASSWAPGTLTPEPWGAALQGFQERHQILLLLCRQVRLQDQVEELHGVVEREEPAVVEIGRRLLDPAQREGLDGTVARSHSSVDVLRLEEALQLEVVHRVVGVVRRYVAGGALGLAEEDRLPPHLRLAGLAWVELAVDRQLGGGREVEQLLELGHEVDLAAALERVDPLLG